MTVDGAATGDVFRASVQYILVPTLRRGDIVMLDNLPSQKDKPALALIEQAGTEVRFLPPYGPDFNPIEKMWSKVKALLHCAAPRLEPRKRCWWQSARLWPKSPPKKRRVGLSRAAKV
jgi:transposase